MYRLENKKLLRIFKNISLPVTSRRKRVQRLNHFDACVIIPNTSYRRGDYRYSREIDSSTDNTCLKFFCFFFHSMRIAVGLMLKNVTKTWKIVRFSMKIGLESLICESVHIKIAEKTWHINYIMIFNSKFVHWLIKVHPKYEYSLKLDNH